MIEIKTAQAATLQLGLCLKELRHDIDLQGSPERCLNRVAFEDDDGRLFVLEQIVPARREKKHYISRTLDRLHTDGLKQVVPYLKTPAGDSPTFCRGGWWQVVPFVSGTPLNRPAYVRSGPRGESLAFFLCDLFRHTGVIPRDPVSACFSLKGYILNMEQTMARHDPDTGRRVAPVLDFLKRSFMDQHDTLPTAFCHGDYHPLNIIWRDEAVAAVIDWEFCGIKPEIYDAANLAGCVGMEHPSGLVDSLVLSFLDVLRRCSIFSDRSWNLFPEFVVALRFAWLAEWLRKKDREMIDLETVYMNLLLENMDMLRAAWEMPG